METDQDGLDVLSKKFGVQFPVTLESDTEIVLILLSVPYHVVYQRRISSARLSRP